MMLAQLFAAVFGDQIIVLESHPALPFDVTAGFESYHIAHNQGVVALRNEYRRFRMLQSKSMSRMMS